MKLDFEVFNSTSRKDWLEKIRSDLKGASPEDFHWELEEGFSVDPFPHGDDLQGKAALEIPGPWLNDWEICESFNLSGNSAEVNAQILDSLKGGCQVLWLTSIDEKTNWETVLEDVDTGLVRIVLRFKSDPFNEALFRKLNQFADAMGQVNLDFCFPTDNVPSAAELIELHSRFPESVFHFESGESQYPMRPVSNLNSFFISFAATYGTLLEVRPELAKSIGFHLPIGPLFFPEIARLMSIRLLWSNFQLALEIEQPSPCYLTTGFIEAVYGNEAEENMVKATTMAMAAIFGKTDGLHILPPGFERASTNSRIARNVHHLLRYEGLLDTFPHMTNGAYYLDQLTRKMTEHCWNGMVKKLAGR